MAWSTPVPITDGTVLTAAYLNKYLRDNLLETEVAKATTPSSYMVSDGPHSIAERIPSHDLVNTTQSESTSSVFIPVNLNTLGPTVSVITGDSALITIAALAFGDDPNTFPGITLEISGATTRPAVRDSPYYFFAQRGVDKKTNMSGVFLLDDLTPGLNIFTLKYAARNGTATFNNRSITVLPF